MTSRDFCYWLQGYFELGGPEQAMSVDQVKIVKHHLAMVFAHEIDPAMGTPEHLATLTELHEPAGISVDGGQFQPPQWTLNKPGYRC